MARHYSTIDTVNHKMTPLVVTLWYRAPELILDSSGQYSTEIDIWSVACILIELLIGKPLFAGEGEIDHLIQIFDVLGTPSVEQWPEFDQLQFTKQYKFKHKPCKLKQMLPIATVTNQTALSELGYDLLLSMLHYNPKQRITASQAIQHRWFQESPKMQNTSFMPSFTRKNNLAK